MEQTKEESSEVNRGVTRGRRTDKSNEDHRIPGRKTLDMTEVPTSFWAKRFRKVRMGQCWVGNEEVVGI